MNRFTWTREKDAELARRYVAGEPVDKIAAQFDCSPSTIKTRCGTLGLLRRRVKTNPLLHGNASFLIGQVLRTALPVDPETFGEELLDKLD